MNPDFDTACREFSHWLETQGFPLEIVWITQQDALYRGRAWTVLARDSEARRASARTRYQQALVAGYGVRMAAICADHRHTYCYLYTPRSLEEAIRTLTYPGPVKMSAPYRLEPAIRVSPWHPRLAIDRLHALRYRKWKSPWFFG